MKLIALHNADGKILAAVRASHDYTGPVPVATDSTTVTHTAVPEEHRHLPLSDICERLRVDVHTGSLVTHQDEYPSKA